MIPVRQTTAIVIVGLIGTTCSFTPFVAPSRAFAFGVNFAHRKHSFTVLAANDAPESDSQDLIASETGKIELSPTELILQREREGLPTSTDPSTQAVVAAAAEREQRAAADLSGEKPYPVELPSPILLATSMILAIAGTGSLFELLGGNPDPQPLGFAGTAAVVLIGFPLGIFFFYAAITKATFETEEDDKAFLSGK